MLMLQLQIFDKFNKHPKYLLQYLIKSNDINYLHYTAMNTRPNKEILYPSSKYRIPLTNSRDLKKL